MIKLREIQKITWCKHGESWSNWEKSKRLLDVSMEEGVWNWEKSKRLLDVSMEKGVSNWEKLKRLLNVSMEKGDQIERNPKDYLM